MPETPPTFASRQSRYTRRPLAPLALTPVRLALLRWVGELGVASIPQLARLACPSLKSAQRHGRELFDAGLVANIAIPRAALLGGQGRLDPALAFGSSPNIYTLTRKGAKCLLEAGLVEEMPAIRSLGPANWAFVAHTLLVGDVRVWLELCARATSGQALDRWRDGGAAAIDLERTKAPWVCRPDAWFVYGVGERVLVGLLEADRATERGERRWREKVAAYNTLFAGRALQAATGFQNARILVITPDEGRSEHLAGLIGAHAPPPLRDRFWLAAREVLSIADLTTPLWRQPGNSRLLPLLPAQPSHDARSVAGAGAHRL